MKNKFSLQTVIGLLITIFVVTACGSPVAEVQEQGPAVQIGSAALGPDKTMSVCAGQTVALTTKTTGRDLTYAWSVDGNGQLQRQEGQGDVASSNRYTAPTATGEEVVRVTVTDDLDQSSTDQVIIQVVECQTAEMSEGSTKEVTEGPTVTVTITEPRSEVECPEADSCIFVIKGTSVETAGNSNYKIVPFVNPSVGNPDTWFPQPDRPLGSDINEGGSWQAEVRIGTEAGEEPGHRFEIVALVMDAAEEITADFQALPSAIAKSNIVNLVTVEPPPPVTLTYPVDGQSVPCENTAKGTYSSGITEPIWPVVYIGGRYHPQDEGGSAPPMSNGKWYGTVRFGTCDQPQRDIGKSFQLLVVTAGEQCNQVFEDYLARARSTGSWPGLPELPEDCTEYVRIVVIRK